MKINDVKKGTRVTPKKDTVNDLSLLNEGEILTVQKIINRYGSRGFVKFEEHPFVYNIANFKEE